MATETLPEPETGYFPGAPKSAWPIDQRIAEAWRCPECGAPMTFRPFYRFASPGRPTGYRAFVFCAKCRHAIEF